MSSLHKTRGIVLNQIKYKETSLIVRIFTESWGLQSYLVHGVRMQKPKHGMALFQPLTLLELVVYRKKQGGLQRLAEVKCYKPNNNILGDIKKASITIFLAELMAKVVREEDQNQPLFNFIWQSVITLDQQADNYELFHISFLLKLGHYLGFGISKAQDIYAQLRRAGQHHGSSQDSITVIDNLIQGGHAAPVARLLRRNITEAIIKFYQLHIESLSTIKSLSVLQALGEA